MEEQVGIIHQVRKLLIKRQGVGREGHILLYLEWGSLLQEHWFQGELRLLEASRLRLFVLLILDHQGLQRNQSGFGLNRLALNGEVDRIALDLLDSDQIFDLEGVLLVLQIVNEIESLIEVDDLPEVLEVYFQVVRAALDFLLDLVDDGPKLVFHFCVGKRGEFRKVFREEFPNWNIGRFLKQILVRLDSLQVLLLELQVVLVVRAELAHREKRLHVNSPVQRHLFLDVVEEGDPNFPQGFFSSLQLLIIWLRLEHLFLDVIEAN